MSSTQDMNGNSHASLQEYLMDSMSSENDKRNRGMNDEMSFGNNGVGSSMKRSKTSFEAVQQTIPGVSTPPITQNTMNNFAPFFGNGGNGVSTPNPTQQPAQQTPTQQQQPQHHYPNPNAAHMMNPHSNPAAVHAAAAAHAAMTAFIAQHMMASSGQHHPQPQVHHQFNPQVNAAAAAAAITQQKNTTPQNNNPMQNLMASYASMMHGAAAATATQNMVAGGGTATPNNNTNTNTGPVSVSNSAIDSAVIQSSSEVSCPTPPSRNISTVANTAVPVPGPNILSRDVSNNVNAGVSAPTAPAMNLQMPAQHAFPGLNNSPSSSMMNLNNNQVVSNVTASAPIPSATKLPVVGGNGPVNTSLIHDATNGTNGGPQPGNKLVGLPQSLATNPFLNMRDLSLEELEEFVRQLQEANQPIPQPLSMLLADARRKEQKKNAKRVANRKSACTSRARKKAYLEEMQRTNRKLRRQALILALLPDLVVALSSDCEISFISAQVERILRFNPDDLVGANMMDLIVPASREALRRLVTKLLQPDGCALTNTEEEELVVAAATASNDNSTSNNTVKKKQLEGKSARDIDRNNSPPVSAGSAAENTNSTNEAVVISEQSFPLSVVQVKNSVKFNEDDGTDGSGNGNDKVAMSSITCSRYSSDNNSNDSSNHNNSLDEDTRGTNSKLNGSKKENSSGSDDSSSDSKNLRKASEALNRNVQLHNAKLCKENVNNHRNIQQHTDDVTGATVTANNADARLSSLQHRPIAGESSSNDKKNTGKNNNPSKLTLENLEAHSNSSSSNSLLEGVEDNNRRINSNKRRDGGNDRDETNGNTSDDSGYGEGSDSFPSREDSSSSDNEDENSSEARKPKPLAPTCTVCLVRVDLTTIWCEVTASIRTNTPDDDDEPQATPGTEKTNANKKNNNNNGVVIVNTQESTEPTNSTDNENEVKEVLLCLRPLRDGDSVGEELRFDLQASKNKCEEIKVRREQEKQLLLQQIKAKMIPSPQKDNSKETTLADVVTNVSDNVSSANSANSSQSANDNNKQTKVKLIQNKGLPFKKRASIEVTNGITSSATKKQKQQLQHQSISLSTSDTEKSVVESLMLMCNKPKK